MVREGAKKSISQAEVCRSFIVQGYRVQRNPKYTYKIKGSCILLHADTMIEAAWFAHFIHRAMY